MNLVIYGDAEVHIHIIRIVDCRRKSSPIALKSSLQILV